MIRLIPILLLLTACTPEGRYITVREADIAGGTLIGTVRGTGTGVTVEESEQPIHACAVIARITDTGRTVVTSSSCK